MEHNILLLTPLLACISGYLAYKYGRSVLLWYIVGIISFPLSILLLLILGKTERKKIQDRQMHEAKKIFEKIFEQANGTYTNGQNPFENKNTYENKQNNQNETYTYREKEENEKNTKPCPFCLKRIDRNSKLCKYCKNPING